jgi:hypothetical protein
MTSMRTIYSRNLDEDVLIEKDTLSDGKTCKELLRANAYPKGK